MDTKRLLTMMLVSFAVIFGWQILMFRIYGPPPKPGQQAAATQPDAGNIAPAGGSTQPTTGIASTAPVTTQGSGSTIAAAPPSAVRIVSPATQPTGATLENEVMTVRLSPHGAGLDSVVLSQFKGGDRKEQFTFQQPYIDVDDPYGLSRALATRSITLNGIEVPVWNVPWTLVSSDAMSAEYEIDLGLAKVRKVFRLRPKAEPGAGYEITVRHVIVNPDDKAPVNARVSFNGANVPASESEQGHDRNIMAGYDYEDGYERVDIDHYLTDQYDASNPTRDITKGDDGRPLLWAGASSVYFNAIVRPEPIDPAKASPAYIDSVTTTALNPGSKPDKRRVATSFTTTELAVAPGNSLALNAQVYFGPRWRSVLNEAPYSAFPRGYSETLVLASGPCAFCTFNWLVNGLVSLLNIFHWIFGGFAGNGDWGLAIIALVVLVRALLHPVTKKAQISMLKMGKLGPEMERLKAKHKDDKDALNREMMQLYKDQGVGAYLGCLPMFLQMPIWIALWSALNSTFELRQAPFLWGFTWIDDLARPDRLLTWNPVQFWLPLMGEVSFGAFNLLPVLLAVVFYLQQEFTPKPPATTPEQQTQQKMMKWMSLLFPIFLYNGPSGLNLYILTSTAIGIIESKRIRDHIKQQEELEKQGKIIVDAGIRKRGGDEERPGGKGARAPKQPTAPKTGLAGWLEQMQAKAEEIRRQAEKGRK